MITAFPEQILVNVGDRVCVRVDPARISKDAREPCGRCTRKRRADAWLDDRVSANYVATIWRKPRLIQRMREGFDHPPGGVAQQLGISIQSDDKPNALELRMRPRWKRKKCPAPCRRFNSSIPRATMSIYSASSGMLCRGASEKSDRSENRRFGSVFPR